MSGDTPRPDQGRWGDIEGTPILVFCWIEQVADNPQRAALFSPAAPTGPGHRPRP